MMKKILLLVLLCSTLIPISYGQGLFEDLCNDAEIVGPFSMTDGTTITIEPFNPAGDDTTSEPMSCTGFTPLYDLHFNFDVPTTGYWELVIDGTAAGATGMYCATFGEDCASMEDILENIDFTTGSTTASCMLLTGGQSYILGLHIEAGGDTQIDFTINSAEEPNDICSTGAIGLSSGSTVSGSTECATDDANFGCASAPEDHVVYYDYISGTTYSDISLDLALVGATGIGMSVWTDCAGTAYDPAVGEICMDGNITLECVPPSTVLVIAVGSLDTEEGGFDLILTETPNPVANDMCVDATVETLNLNCTITNIVGDNTDACPEVGISVCNGMIEYDSNPVVWHQFSMPTNATELILDAINSGSIEITLFSDCPDMGGAIVGGSSCVAAAPTTFTGLTPGATYYIGVASETETEGPYDFDLLAVTPPDNDDCMDAEDLSGGSLPGETNACASAEAGEPFGACGGDGDDATVWYTYDVASDIQDLTISLTATGIVDNYLIAYDACGGTVIEED